MNRSRFPKVETLTVNYTREGFQETMKRGLIMVKNFDYAATAYKLKVVVRDAPSGNVGSVNIRTDGLSPPAPSTATPAARPYSARGTSNSRDSGFGIRDWLAPSP